MIDKIGNRCTGCYACVNRCPKDCIRMTDNREGFWYPEIDTSKCIGCGLCEKACPVLTEIPIPKTDAGVKVYALIHKDEEIRSKSSSGGAFSAIAEYILDRDGVVFGAAFDKNFDVHHIPVEHREDLHKLRGSKYVQSRIGNAYAQAKAYLDAGRLVFFTGTACQTSGLIGYLGRDYDNLITQDLICHGVPSPMVWRKYLKLQQQREHAKVEHVFFRDKRFGWHNWHVFLRFRNGSEYRMNQREDMMTASFLRGKCSRESCYDCPFKQKIRLADFTLADLWGAEHMAADLDDDKGISACFVNSPKAAEIIRTISDKVLLRELDPERAVFYNMAMVESETRNPQRDDFLRDAARKSFDMVSGKYNEEVSLSVKIKWTLRRILGNQVYDRLLGRLTGGNP